MPWRPHGRARVDPSSPEAWAICDRCGFTYNHKDLQWQFQWSGPQLINLRLLVCDICLDKPQEQLRSILIPPDPLPIMNPRTQNYTVEEEDWCVAALAYLDVLNDQASYSDSTIVQVIDASALTNLVGQQIRVQFVSANPYGAVINSAYIGLGSLSGDAYDFASTPTQLLFDGSGQATLAPTVATTSDAASFVVTTGYNLVVAADFLSGGTDILGARSLQDGWTAYYKNGANEAGTVDKTGYTESDYNALFVQQVEILQTIAQPS